MRYIDQATNWIWSSELCNWVWKTWWRMKPLSEDFKAPKKPSSLLKSSKLKYFNVHNAIGQKESCKHRQTATWSQPFILRASNHSYQDAQAHKKQACKPHPASRCDASNQTHSINQSSSSPPSWNIIVASMLTNPHVETEEKHPCLVMIMDTSCESRPDMPMHVRPDLAHKLLMSSIHP